MIWPTHALPTDGQLELSLKGKVDERTSALWIELVERKSQKLPEGRRVLRVAIELIQNLHHHALVNHATDSRFLCVRRKESWLLSTSNAISAHNAGALQSQIRTLQQMSAHEVREAHRELLAGGPRPAHGGGGVGLYEIYRKTGGQIHLALLPSPATHQWSVLTAEIPSPHE